MVIISLCSLNDSENPLPFGQTKRKTETKMILALALENEHQMYLSLFPSCFFFLLFKLLEVHPNWVLNAN